MRGVAHPKGWLLPAARPTAPIGGTAPPTGFGGFAIALSASGAVEPVGQCAQMLDELGRFVHFEVESQHRDA